METTITFKQLQQYIKDNNIPEDVSLLSDSGWECGETGIRAVYYNKEENALYLYQDKKYFSKYHKDPKDIQRQEATQLLPEDTFNFDYYFKDN